MLSLLHLRRGRHEPPRKHHRLGIDGVPYPLRRRHPHQVGHLPLQLRTLTSPRVSREHIEANLKRDLPHIPFAKDFWGFAEAGARLADLHVNYESQPEYDNLKFVQNPNAQLNWRVEKMKLSKDKTSLIYNDFLTLSGIPPKAHDYRLGTRSALEWVIDQYRVKTDKRSGIVNDPNRADDPQYIVKLIGQVITVSLETVDIVENLPAL